MSAQKSARTSGYSELLVRRGPQRLACAVLAQAIQDYLVWHSDLGKTVRKALAGVDRTPRGSVRGGEWERHGVPAGSSGLTKVVRICDDDDPGEFLTGWSLWHEVAGVDPADFARLLDDRQQLQRVAQLLGSKKAPRPVKARGA